MVMYIFGSEEEEDYYDCDCEDCEDEELVFSQFLFS